MPGAWVVMLVSLGEEAGNIYLRRQLGLPPGRHRDVGVELYSHIPVPVHIHWGAFGFLSKRTLTITARATTHHRLA